MLKIRTYLWSVFYIIFVAKTFVDKNKLVCKQKNALALVCLQKRFVIIKEICGW
jgi:hypothetical protein